AQSPAPNGPLYIAGPLPTPPPLRGGGIIYCKTVLVLRARIRNGSPLRATSPEGACRAWSSGHGLLALSSGERRSSALAPVSSLQPAPSLLVSLPRPPIQPRLDLTMPLDAVSRLEHPMVLVREDDESTRYAAPLQRRERRNALRVRYAIVAQTVNHEHWHAPFAHVVCRVVLLVVLRDLKRRTAMFPFGEPPLFGGIAHEATVENACMVHKALERLRPVARNPVDHVTAE